MPLLLARHVVRGDDGVPSRGAHALDRQELAAHQVPDESALDLVAELVDEKVGDLPDLLAPFGEDLFAFDLVGAPAQG